MSGNNAPHDTADERAPLLQRQPQDDVYNDTQQQAPASGWKKFHKKFLPSFDVIHPRYRFIPLLGCLIIFFNESEYMVKQVAMMRAIEAMHCIEYYEKFDPDIARMGKHIPARLCKNDSIQKDVARSAALQLFCRMACAMIGNIPLGYIADKFGRKIVLSLHKINVVFSSVLQILTYVLYPKWPIWMLYVSGLPGLIGGNFDLGLAMLFASYTDVLVHEAQRTTLLYLTTAMQYPSQALGPILGGILMNLDGQDGTPHVSLLVGFSCGMVALILTVAFFPETIQENRKATDDANSQAKPSNSSDNDSSDDDDDFSRKPHGLADKVAENFKRIVRGARRSVRGIGLGNMFLLSLLFLTSSIGIKSIDWLGLVQYPVVKLHWKFSQSTIAMSVQACIIIVNYAFLLPLYNRIGTQRLRMSAARTSLVIMFISTVLLIIGSTIIGFSASVVVFFVGLLVYTLGEGLPVATQAYIASSLDKTMLARTLAALSVAQVGGKALASALFPKVMAAGLDDGREFMKGLPMFVGAALFIVASFCVVVVAVTSKSSRIEHTEVENDADAAGHS